MVDVVVSKLKRFNLHDVEDIAAMVDRSLVSHGDLISRFRMAVDGYSMDSRADDLPKYVANLHRVERDLFDLAPTDIELSNWIG